MSDVVLQELREYASTTRLEDLLNVYCALSRIRHQPADAAYLFAQTADDEESVFEGARELQQRGLADKFLITDARNWGFQGPEPWTAKLRAYFGDNVYVVPSADPDKLNTLTEANALMQFAKKENLQSVYLLAPPFHIIRAFMTAVTSCLRTTPDFRLYPYEGAELDWNMNGVHSQRLKKDTRLEHLRLEIKKIRKYQITLDIMPAKFILEYAEALPQR